MANFVLVHGAWHGGWCWSRVKPYLEAAGATVYAPSLTGLGERSHLATPDVSLETHVQDLIHLVEYERLDDVVLVAHSYAGVVATVVADRIPRRLSRLIYLDAIVPNSGQCLFDRASATLRSRFEDSMKAQAETWRVPVPGTAMLGLTDEADISWTMPRLVPHPYRTLCEPALFGNGGAAIRRSYINCIGHSPPGGARSAQADGIDEYHELATGHDAMVTLAESVAARLLGH